MGQVQPALVAYRWRGPVLVLGIGTASSWPLSHADEALGEEADARGPRAESVCAVAGCAADLGQEKAPHSPVGDAGQGKAPRAAAWPETRWVPFSVPFSVVRSAFLGRGSSCTCSAAAHAYRCPTTSPAAPLRRENRPKVRIFWRPLCPEHLRVGCSRLSGGYSADPLVAEPERLGNHFLSELPVSHLSFPYPADRGTPSPLSSAWNRLKGSGSRSGSGCRTLS